MSLLNKIALADLYPAGPFSWSGKPTKIDLDTSTKQYGITPGTFPAEYLNRILSELQGNVGIQQRQTLISAMGSFLVGGTTLANAGLTKASDFSQVYDPDTGETEIGLLNYKALITSGSTGGLTSGTVSTTGRPLDGRDYVKTLINISGTPATYVTSLGTFPIGTLRRGTGDYAQRKNHVIETSGNGVYSWISGNAMYATPVLIRGSAAKLLAYGYHPGTGKFYVLTNVGTAVIIHETTDFATWATTSTYTATVLPTVIGVSNASPVSGGNSTVAASLEAWNNSTHAFLMCAGVGTGLLRAVISGSGAVTWAEQTFPASAAYLSVYSDGLNHCATFTTNGETLANNLDFYVCPSLLTAPGSYAKPGFFTGKPYHRNPGRPFGWMRVQGVPVLLSKYDYSYSNLNTEELVATGLDGNPVVDVIPQAFPVSSYAIPVPLLGMSRDSRLIWFSQAGGVAGGAVSTASSTLT